MTRWVLATLALAVLLAAAALARFERSNVLLEPSATYALPEGAGALRVLADLADAGWIEQDPRWRVWLQLRRPAACLQAGVHELPSSATPAELFAALCQPTRAPDVAITLTEGETLFAFARRLVEAGFAATEDEVLALAFDAAFAAELGVPSSGLEGYVFPDTYRVAPDASPRAIFTRMVEHGREVHASVFAEPTRSPLIADLGLSDADLVTIASIVEREAVVPDEEPRIARVVYNRLAAGMKLQMDPTCVYDRALDGQAASPETCRDPASRYSTYVIEGLPPTPIGNPGRSALRATLAPADDPDVLYFVAIGDGSGRHAFADDYDTHRANVRALRARRAAEASTPPTE